tara:strand:+ start:177 stop:695 length:519 start_codon:yes stop_codon:yes gene_type:complete
MALKTTDILPEYKEKYFNQAKEVLKNLKECSERYHSMDNLYDVDGLEQVKRDMGGYLENLGEHFARVKRYKTMGDYLEEHRKAIKSEAIDRIVLNSRQDESVDKISQNQAEKIVYNSDYYKQRLDMLLQIKGFFSKIEIMYERYVDVMNNIRQSVSMCKKDPNFKPIDDVEE